MDALHIRWLTFCEVKPFPRDTNEIILAVVEKLDGDPFVNGLTVSDELQYLEDNDLLVVHAEDEARDLLEVRLNDEGL